MRIFVVTLICAWSGVALGQNENGIVFGSNPNPTYTVPTGSVNPRDLVEIISPQIVNQNCVCALPGTCTPSNTNIDIRIVNNGPTPSGCPAGYVLCCSNQSGNQVDGTCGVRKIPSTPSSVVGQAPFGAYPWQTALLTTQEAFLGSGVLLDATHVLTAAHKVAAYVANPAAMLVRLGEWNGQSTTEPYPAITSNVARITVHPNFNPNNLENDVAVIRLNGVVNVASYPNINTACRPATPPVAGSRCYVSGWGKNLFGPTGAYQSIMREVDVPILDNTDCENRLRQTRLGAAYVLNRNSFMCAGGEQGKDACTGDGGSPLVCRRASGQWEVVGIVAWGIGCANPGVPGVYTNVYNFLSWINTAIATA